MALPADRTRFSLRWTLRVAAGERMGFGFASAVAAGAMVAGLSDQARYPIVVLPGGVERALLGTAQFLATEQHRPRPAAWIGAASAAATVAWAVGTLVSLFPQVPSPPLMILGGLVIIASIPTAQWAALRRPHTVRWIPVNVGAWAVAVLWTFVPSLIVDEFTPVGTHVLLYVLSGVLMALTVAMLTVAVLAAPTAE